VVCNASRYGGRFVLAPAADIFTPGFELVCVRKSSRTAYVALVLATIRGRSGRQEDICRFTCRKLSISGSKAIQIDGDFWGHAPVTVTATADFVRLIV
jgi:diacylglycerol kinase family enzyme